MSFFRQKNTVLQRLHSACNSQHFGPHSKKNSVPFIDLGTVSWNILSVIFTDKWYNLLISLNLIGWEKICRWNSQTRCFMKLFFHLIYIIHSLFKLKFRENVRVSVELSVYTSTNHVKNLSLRWTPSSFQIKSLV